MDLNDVKAGKYQLVAVRWDQIISKPGEPLDFTRHRRGAIVDLNAEDAKRLVSAGAVVKPGELEKARAEEARALAERAAADYQAILAGLPEDVRAEVAPNTVAQLLGEPDGAFDPAKGGGVKDTLAYVGDDDTKATAMLELEEARDTPRVTLVEKLEAVIDAAGGDQ